jgi:hypothetical protein
MEWPAFVNMVMNYLYNIEVLGSSTLQRSRLILILIKYIQCIDGIISFVSLPLNVSVARAVIRWFVNN